MEAFETAIRNALQKVDPADARQRQRIYKSARDALGNSQTKQGIWGTEAAGAQDRRLEELIERIDVEFRADTLRPERAATAPAPVLSETAAKPSRQTERREPPPMHQEPNRRPQSEPRTRQRTPTDSGPAADTLRVEPLQGERRTRAPSKKASRRAAGKALDPDLIGAAGPQTSTGKKKARRSRPIFSLILVASLAIAFIGMGILWAVFNGLFLTAEQRDTSIPNPPATIDGGDFAGDALSDGSFSSDWISVFTPDDVSRLSGRGGAEAAVVDSFGRPALQVVSSGAGTDSEILFELDPGLLQTLAGRKALVAMTLRTSTDTPTQMYVRCVLPTEAGCGRHRFDVSYEVGDVVFSLDLPAQIAGSGSGYLALNSDVAGTGQGVDVFAIRIRPE
ncbi:MAG: hypothetical protein AAF724_01310 [Pseudomonadota bacterium]